MGPIICIDFQNLQYSYLAPLTLCYEALNQIDKLLNVRAYWLFLQYVCNMYVCKNNLILLLCNCRNFYSSKDFRNAYNLMAHEDSITEDMWLLRGLVAVFLLKCLQRTDFFHQRCVDTLVQLL